MIPTPDLTGPCLSLSLDQKMAGRTHLIGGSYDLAQRFAPLHLEDGSEQDLAGLTEFADKTVARTPDEALLAPNFRVSFLLDRNPFCGPFEVQSLAKSPKATDRQGLYETYKADPANALWNVFPGRGVGSYIERDYPFAFLFTVGALPQPAGDRLWREVSLQPIRKPNPDRCIRRSLSGLPLP